jgi:hypothetical protein
MDCSLPLTLIGKSLGDMTEPVSDDFFFQFSNRRATVTLFTQDGTCREINNLKCVEKAGR